MEYYLADKGGKLAHICNLILPLLQGPFQMSDMQVFEKSNLDVEYIVDARKARMLKSKHFRGKIES